MRITFVTGLCALNGRNATGIAVTSVQLVTEESRFWAFRRVLGVPDQRREPTSGSMEGAEPVRLRPADGGSRTRGGARPRSPSPDVLYRRCTIVRPGGPATLHHNEMEHPVRISVIGCGYLGAVHAASMAELGHDVVGIDVDQRKIDALADGEGAVLRARASRSCSARTLATGRLRFSTDIGRRRAAAQVHFVCVGTPQKRGEYAADLRYVEARRRVRCSTSSSRATSWSASRPSRSAPRPGWPTSSTGKVPGALLAWNPEFLREGFAVQDTLHPDRLVYGLPDGRRRRDRPRRCSTRSTPPIARGAAPRRWSPTTPPRRW